MFRLAKDSDSRFAVLFTDSVVIFRYRRNVLIWLCPVIFIISVWGEPDATILVVGDNREV
jgi:hypothetical protein